MQTKSLRKLPYLIFLCIIIIFVIWRLGKDISRLEASLYIATIFFVFELIIKKHIKKT